jgi:hypothetical protein
MSFLCRLLTTVKFAVRMSSASIGCDAPHIKNVSFINQVLLDNPRSANNVAILETIRKLKSLRNASRGSLLEPSILKLGEGGYNDVFLISLVSVLLLRNRVNSTHLIHQGVDPNPFVLRLPKEGCLLPYQVLNEITCISVVASYCPNIPVPAVLGFAADSSDAFILQEYICGEPLSSCWNRFAESEKYQVSQRIAEIIVQMGEMRFDMIGGFTGGKNGLLGPTVEGCKLFNGRVSSPFMYLLCGIDTNR